MPLKITLKAMEIYVWIICIAVLIVGFCLLPIAGIIDLNIDEDRYL